MESKLPVEKRIPDIETAQRCIATMCEGLRYMHESPLGAEDLPYAIELIIRDKQRDALKEGFVAARMIYDEAHNPVELLGDKDFEFVNPLFHIYLRAFTSKGEK